MAGSKAAPSIMYRCMRSPCATGQARTSGSASRLHREDLPSNAGFSRARSGASRLSPARIGIAGMFRKTRQSIRQNRIAVHVAYIRKPGTARHFKPRHLGPCEATSLDLDPMIANRIKRELGLWCQASGSGVGKGELEPLKRSANTHFDKVTRAPRGDGAE